MRKTGSTATKAWLESPHRHDIDTAAEHVLQKDAHAQMTAKRGGSLELDEDVAVWAGLVAAMTSTQRVIRAVIPPWLGVQQRARRHGNVGIYGIDGIVESVTCRFQKPWQSSNPTLSAKSDSVFSIT
jgi:hypothetical protein